MTLSINPECVRNGADRYTLNEMLCTETLETLIRGAVEKLKPCPCCGSESPRVQYYFLPFVGTQADGRCSNHELYVQCPHPFSGKGCGLRTVEWLATEDVDYVDFKEALRRIVEAWNRRP